MYPGGTYRSIVCWSVNASSCERTIRQRMQGAVLTSVRTFTHSCIPLGSDISLFGYPAKCFEYNVFDGCPSPSLQQWARGGGNQVYRDSASHLVCRLMSYVSTGWCHLQSPSTYQCLPWSGCQVFPTGIFPCRLVRDQSWFAHPY